MSPHYGGREWIRTTEVVDGRFTVCSLWPLGNSPIFSLLRHQSIILRCSYQSPFGLCIRGGAGGRTKPRYARFPCSVTVASQQYRPRTSRLKTIHRIVFFTALTLTGFESVHENIRHSRGWSWWTDSNPRPADYKSAALPTELHQHFQRSNIIAYKTRFVKQKFIFSRLFSLYAFP